MTDQKLLQEFRSLEAGSMFISENFLTLQKDFGNQFIVVNDSSVLDSAESFQEILKKLEERKINHSEIIIQFIPKVGQIILY
jgi:hypothetical protein